MVEKYINPLHISYHILSNKRLEIKGALNAT